MRISLNIDGKRLDNKRREYVINLAKQARFNRILIMDDFNLALEMYDQVGQYTKVDFRLWGEHDGKYWNSQLPGTYIPPSDYASIITANGHPEIGRYVLNEPVGGSDLGWHIMFNWLEDVAKALSDRGYHAILGNIGPATWPIDAIENGVFDDYLKTLAQYQSLGFRGGWHEYTAILLPFGVSQWPHYYLLNRNDVQVWPRNLPKKRIHYKPDNKTWEEWLPYWNRLTNEAKARITRDGELPHYYHIRRIDWLDLRCDEIGVARHKKVITEAGHDRLNDIPQILYQDLESKYGANGFNELRGPVSLAGVWRYYWPHQSFEQSWMSQAIWLDEIYDKDVEAMNFFTWSPGSNDWDKQWGFNLEPFTNLHSMMIEYSKEQEQPMPEEPQQEQEYGPPTLSILSDIDQTSITHRKSPGTTSARLGSIPHGALVHACKPLKDIKVSGYLWAKVTYNDVEGYVAIMSESFEKQFIALPEIPHDGEDDNEEKVAIVAMLEEVIERVHRM